QPDTRDLQQVVVRFSPAGEPTGEVFGQRQVKRREAITSLLPLWIVAIELTEPVEQGRALRAIDAYIRFVHPRFLRKKIVTSSAAVEMSTGSPRAVRTAHANESRGGAQASEVSTVTLTPRPSASTSNRACNNEPGRADGRRTAHASSTSIRRSSTSSR